MGFYRIKIVEDGKWAPTKVGIKNHRMSFMDVTFHKFQNWANATLNFDSTSYSKAICAGHFEKCYEQ